MWKLLRIQRNYMPRIFHITPTCESSSSLKVWMSFITRITFTPSDIVFSNCVDLFTFKGQPLPWLNSTWQRIVRRGQPNACITPASKRSKLIYPINEEWGLMLMRDDNSTGQLFFIALLLHLWTNHKRQSNKYFHHMRFVSLCVSSPSINAATPLPLKDDRTWYGSLRK